MGAPISSWYRCEPVPDRGENCFSHVGGPLPLFLRKSYRLHLTKTTTRTVRVMKDKISSTVSLDVECVNYQQWLRARDISPIIYCVPTCNYAHDVTRVTLGTSRYTLHTPLLKKFSDLIVLKVKEVDHSPRRFALKTNKTFYSWFGIPMCFS